MVSRGALVAALLGAWAGLPASETPLTDAAADALRGELLYLNHCTGCHESTVHLREDRHESTVEGVQRQVQRWSGELQLGWGEQERRDVVEFLLQNYYRF